MNEILGIDIGGTGIKGAVVNVNNGKLITERLKLNTPSPSSPSNIVKVVLELIESFGWVGPIGIGFPSVLKKGIALTAGNINHSWIGTDVLKKFKSSIKNTITLINDADAAGIAEMKWGVAKGQPGVVMMVTLGTGIGTAIFNDGKLLPNTELGHLIIRGYDAEKRASGQARDINNWSWKKWGKNVSEYLNELDRLLWPDLFVIGGGVSERWLKFESYIKVRPPVIKAEFGNNAGIAGAALIAHLNNKNYKKKK